MVNVGLGKEQPDMFKPCWMLDQQVIVCSCHVLLQLSWALSYLGTVFLSS